MKSLPLIIVLFCCIFIISCNKSGDITPPNVITTDPVRLTQAFSLDTTRPVPFDTAGRAYYYYDSQGRPSMITGVHIKPAGDTGYFMRFNYFYNGNDTLAARTIEYRYSNVTGTASQITDTIDYTWSGGKLIADSAYSSASRVSERFTYEPGIVRRTLKRYFMNNTVQLLSNRIIHLAVDNNNNIIHQVDTLTSGSGPSTIYTRFESNASYLTNPNPFGYFSRPVRRPSLIDDDITAVDYAPEKLWQVRSFASNSWGVTGPNGGAASSKTFSYEFLSNGYPSKIRSVSLDGSRTIMVLKYQ